MTDHLQAIVTVLSLVNPAICGAMFSKIEAGRPHDAQLTDATKAIAAILVILVLAALFGAWLLSAFGVSLDAFKVAGGGVLAWMGFTMLSGKSPESSSTKTDAPSEESPSLTPLILFAASPGTITGVITLSVVHTKLGLPVTALVAVGATMLVTWLVIVLAARAGGGEGGFVRDTTTRFMGLIVVAMGVQFALTGIDSFMNGGG